MCLAVVHCGTFYDSVAHLVNACFEVFFQKLKSVLRFGKNAGKSLYGKTEGKVTMPNKRKKNAHISAYVDKSTKERLQKLGKLTGRTSSQILRILIEDATPQLLLEIQRKRIEEGLDSE